MGRARGHLHAAAATKDSFNDVMGARRGPKEDDQLHAEHPSPAAKRKFDDYMEAFAHGDVNFVLETLAGIPTMMDRPLPSKLLDAVTGELAHQAQAGRARRYREVLTKSGLRSDQASALLRRSNPDVGEPDWVHVWPAGQRLGPHDRDALKKTKTACGLGVGDAGLVAAPRGAWKEPGFFDMQRCPDCLPVSAMVPECSEGQGNPLFGPALGMFEEALYGRIRKRLAERLAQDPSARVLAAREVAEQAADDTMVEVGGKIGAEIGEAAIQRAFSHSTYAELREETGHEHLAPLLTEEDWAEHIAYFVNNRRGALSRQRERLAQRVRENAAAQA